MNSLHCSPAFIICCQLQIIFCYYELLLNQFRVLSTHFNTPIFIHFLQSHQRLLSIFNWISLIFIQFYVKLEGQFWNYLLNWYVSLYPPFHFANSFCPFLETCSNYFEIVYAMSWYYSFHLKYVFVTLLLNSLLLVLSHSCLSIFISPFSVSITFLLLYVP